MTNRKGWLDSGTARELAAARLGYTRQIEALPLLPPGWRYAQTRSGDAGGFTAQRASVHVGGAYVYKSTAGAKVCWYVVCANSGLAFGSFGKASQARALCAALGPRVCDYFARAAAGDARAATAIARLTRIHVTRARSTR